MGLLDQNFKKTPKAYLFQSICASGCILIILLALDIRTHSAIIASLGASAFIVFTAPRQYFSQPKPLIGGYLIGITMGVLFHFTSQLSIFPSVFSSDMRQIICGASAVGISILLMVITNTEHAPAAGMTLSLVFNRWNFHTLGFIIAAVVFLSIFKKILNPFLRDLIGQKDDRNFIA